MITQHNINKMSMDELKEYSEQQNACANFMNSLLPGDLTPNTIAATIRRTFIAGWVAKDKDQSDG